MNPHVHQRAPALRLLLQKLSPRRYASPAEDGSLGVINFSKGLLAAQFFQIQAFRSETMVGANGQTSFLLFGFLCHLFGFFQRNRHRFLAKNVLSAPQRRNRQFRVKSVGRTNMDDMNGRILQHFLHRGIRTAIRKRKFFLQHPWPFRTGQIA